MTGRPRSPGADLDRVAVVIPAYHEAAVIGACLDSVAVAADRCPVTVRVIVVADSCRDGTAGIARAAGADVVEVALRNVGMVRAVGSLHALAGGTRGLWLAHTDADSAVPPGWLAGQLAHARGGADVTAGRIRVDEWPDWVPDLRAHHDRRYRYGHRHVHGCNLGLSAEAYLRAGGFPPLPVGEDRALVRAADRAGLAVAYPPDITVRTSSRRHARVAEGGFHAYLAALADELA